MRRWTGRILLLAISLSACIALAELGLRWHDPYGTFGAAWELGWMRENPRDLSRLYTVDEDFGFRPVLGRGFYTRSGTLKNRYRPEKPPGVVRLLFAGDSVTRRGQIVRALEGVYGKDDFEYWNAGVTSFTTSQEVAFYRRFNRRIRPDHVILTFHFNDYETTPVAFFDEGRLVVYAPRTSSREFSPWLFTNSHLYRLWLGTRLGGQRDEEAMAREVRAALAELQTLTREDGAGLTVLVLPPLRPSEQWGQQARRRHERTLAMLRDLGIRHFDLLPGLERALRRGIDPHETPGDRMHPSAAVSRVFARYLYEQGLLRADAGAGSRGEPVPPPGIDPLSRASQDSP